MLAVISSELHHKPRTNKDWVTEKVQRIICVRDITYLTARTPAPPPLSTALQRFLILILLQFFSYLNLRYFYWLPLLFIFIFIEETNQFRMFYKKNISVFRSSRSQTFFEIGALKNFAIFTRKQLSVLESFFKKVAELTPGLLLEKFVNTLTKLHYSIFVMDLAYCYYIYSKAVTETYSEK